MQQGYSTTRIVLSLISVLGFVLLLLAPVWLLIFGSIVAPLGFSTPAGGIVATTAQAFFALALIAGSQLGLAQIEVANNTAAILSIIEKQQIAAQPTPESPLRKEPKLRAAPAPPEN